MLRTENHTSTCQPSEVLPGYAKPSRTGSPHIHHLSMPQAQCRLKSTTFWKRFVSSGRSELKLPQPLEMIEVDHMRPLGSRRYDNRWNTCSTHVDQDVLRSEEVRILRRSRSSGDTMNPGGPPPISGVGLPVCRGNESIRMKF
jgi:hypothetical protein